MVKVLLAGGENSVPGVEEHRLRFLVGGVADGLTGWGGAAVVGLRRRCGGGAVLAAFVLRAANFYGGEGLTSWRWCKSFHRSAFIYAS